MRSLCVLMSVLMISSALSACGDNEAGKTEDGKKTESTDKKSDEKKVKMLYKNEKIALPEEIRWVNNIYVGDDGICTVNNVYNYDEKTQTSTNQYFYYVIGFDGTVISKKDISPKAGEKEDVFFGNMFMGKDGSFWAIEYHYPIEPIPEDTPIEAKDAPAGEEVEAAVVETSAASSMSAETAVDSAEEDTENPEDQMKIFLKKFSSDGTELFSKDIKNAPEFEGLFGENTNAYINQMNTDKDGNVYFCKEDYAENKTSVIVLDAEGNFLFEASPDSTSEEGYSSGWTQGFFAGNDGQIYVMRSVWKDGEPGNKSLLFHCNPQTKKLERVENVPENIADNANGIVDGGGDYLFYCFENNTICGYKSDGTCDELYNTINNGLDVEYLDRFYPNGDGFLVVTNDYTEDDVNCILYNIKKREESEIKEKVEVTLSAYYLDSAVRSAVANYNDSDGDYAITVTDYSKYNDYSTGNEDDYQAGLTRLKADIAAGNIADIICAPYDRSFASKGLYYDINNFIDGEDGLNRDEYADFLFRGYETDGKLYAVPINFYIVGFAEKKEFVPNDGALSAEDLSAILSAHDGMNVFSSDYSRENYLAIILSYSGNKFCNYDTGECYFDSPEFIKALEDSAKYPEKVEYGEDYDWEAYESQYITNKTLSAPVYISSYNSMQYNAAQLGGDISVTGVPGLNSNPVIAGNGLIMISSKSSHPEAGWQLIKSVLSEEAQTDMYQFPVNKAALRKNGEKVIESQYYTDENGNKVLHESRYYINGQEVKLPPIDEKQLAWIDSLMTISEVSASIVGEDTFIMDIVKEEAAAFYAGTNTAEVAANNIQSRVKLYISEQS